MSNPTPSAVVPSSPSGFSLKDFLSSFLLTELFKGMALAGVINILDPQVIVLGGGLSKMQRLYRNLPACCGQHVFSDVFQTRILPPQHGDSSGVRGAAWLWN